MKNILSIIKKEFSRFFKDKRMLITTLLLPGFMIYAIYSFTGVGMTSSLVPSDDYVYNIYVYGNEYAMASNSIGTLLTEENINKTFKDNGISFNIKMNVSPDVSGEEALKKLNNKEIDLIISYPENFGTFGGTDTIIEIFYNSVDKNSSNAYSNMYSYYVQLENAIPGANKYDINTNKNVDGTPVKYDVATEKETSAQIFSMILPMLLVMLLFSGCISIAPESIAGEKERGTIATLLVTPINRTGLAIGKIISLSAIGLLSGISSFIGTIASLPNMLGQDVDLSNVYTAGDYIGLFLIIISCSLLFTAIIAIISAYSKSVKEATSLINPVLILVTLLGFSSLFTDGAVNKVALYLIPIYNAIQTMTAIFSLKFSITTMLVTLISNAVYTAMLVVLLSKMFNSEKIMFNK